MSAAHLPQDRWLDLSELLRELLAQGRISQDAAEQAMSVRHQAAGNLLHPLEVIAGQQLPDLQQLGTHLNLESLTAWLARQAGQPYLRIDPLRIDVASITPLMSFAFAQRHKILAVAVDGQSVTVASAQPYVRALSLIHI